MGERKRWKCDLGEILGVKSAEEVGGNLRSQLLYVAGCDIWIKR